MDRLTVFAFLLASAVVFEQAKWDGWAISPAEVVLSCSALWLLLRPRSVHALLTLLLALLWILFQRLPWVSNHYLLLAIVAATVLAALAPRLRSDGWPPDREAWFDAFAPALRLEVVLLYLWAFFHKLNGGWFDPEVSCAVLLGDVLAGRLGAPSAIWPREAAIYLGVAAEAAIPLLLLVRRTRMVGVVVAAGFHWLLGIATFFNFSAVMYALLFVFLPARSTDRLGRWLASLRKPALRVASAGGWHRAYVWTFRAFMAVAVAALLYHASWSVRPGGLRFLVPERLKDPRSALSHGFEALWWLYGGAMLVFLVLLLVERAPRGKAPGFAIKSPLLAVFPLLVLLNGAAPYLGLKTETAFSMFSNLRTEASYANHLVLGRGTRLAGYQDDLVFIESSNDDELARLGANGYALPYFEFRSYVSRRSRATGEAMRVTFIREGRRVEVADAAKEPELARPDDRLARKLLWFRPVFTGSPPPCAH